MIDFIHGVMRPKHLALSILTGDFNFVLRKEDRWTKASGEWSGQKDHGEADLFKHHFCVPGSEFLQELEQDEYTFDGNTFQSKLDRVYSSHSVADQLDRWHVCVALPYARSCSDHRPVAFARTSPTEQHFRPQRFPMHIIQDERWKPLVVARFHQLILEDARRLNAFR